MFDSQPPNVLSYYASPSFLNIITLPFLAFNLNNLAEGVAPKLVCPIIILIDMIFASEAMFQPCLSLENLLTNHWKLFF